MSKKGLFASLVVACVLTLSLGIYTLVSVFGGAPQKPKGPQNVVENLAFRTNDIVDELSGYTEEDFVVTVLEGEENPLKYNEESGKFIAVNAGEVRYVVTIDKKGNTKTLNIKVFAQGNGSKESPFIITRAAHLVEFANDVNTASAGRRIPEYVKLVADIDLKDINWKPIGGQGNTEYTGNFDGNGFTVKNLSISVNAENYANFLTTSVSTKSKAFMDLGLFGKINNATIKNLNVENATITVANEVYNIIKEGTKPEGAEFDVIDRLSIGTIAGSAYNSDIVGSEAKNSILSKITAFSCGNNSQAHGVGGLVGVAQLVRVNNYNVKVNVSNTQATIKGSNIGGVFGSSYSSYDYDSYDNDYSASHKTVIDNVDVDLSATVFYENSAYVGGIVGLGNNTSILNSNVSSFKIVDNTARQFVKYDLKYVTTVAGVATQLVSSPITGGAAANKEVVDAFVSSVENVKVNNVDVFMLGGDAAGAFGYVGRKFNSDAGLKESMVIKDVTVAGNMIANRVGGFAYEVRPGVTVTYSKMFDKAVVDVDLQANMSAGFVFINQGRLIGNETSVEVTEGDKTVSKLVKTRIEVNTIGMGALIENPTAELVFIARESTFATGLVGVAQTNGALLTNDLGKAVVENFDVAFTASNSINYGGLAFNSENISFKNISVNADFTSYNYSKLESNISTTYMVSGGVCEAYVGTELSKITVAVNANKNIQDKTLKYGATFFGGLVARYQGDSETAGLTIANSEVSGDVYFNYSYETVKFGDVSYDVFIAGGLIGAVESKVGPNPNIDGFTIANINKTANLITSNTVSNLKITADFKNEVLGNQGYRVRGIGALVGVVNADLTAPVFDLSTNVVTNVEIVADSDTFTYAYETQIGGSKRNTTLGANKLNSYGASYSWNCEIEGKITNPEEIGVTYTNLD